MTFPGRNPSRSRCVAALGALAALGLLTPGTRADWFEDPAVFTPDSWSRGPLPTPVAPVDGTRAWGYDVGPYDHGLTFPRSPGVVGGTAAAITTIAGAYAWAPASLTPDRQFARLDFRAPLAGRFDILPVSDAYPLGLRCLTVEFLGTGRGELSAFDWSGRPVGWNSAVACAPAQTSLEGIVGSVPIQRVSSNPNSTGADYSGGGFKLDGSLTYGANPGTWPFFKSDLHPPCNANGIPAFVELHNVTVVGVNVSNCGNNYSIDNGGGSYPNGWQSCDVTFNFVTPGFGDDTTCPTCYLHRLYAGIDRDWNASGLAPPRPLEGERVDVQGFVFWNNVFVNASWHSYSGWELHPVSAWRSTSLSVIPTISVTPSTPLSSQATTLSGTAKGGTAPYIFTWDFGDGTTATGNQVNHYYPIGTFTVHLSALDAQGTRGLASRNITVKGPPSFGIAASPTVLSLTPGQTNSSRMVLTSINGFSGNVSLSASITPSGLTGAFNQSIISLSPGGSASTILTLSASQAALPGTYQVSLLAISGNLSAATQMSANVLGAPTFTLAITPASLTLPPGTTAKTNVTLTSFAGFKGSVQLNNSPLPAGVHMSFNPQGVTLTGGGTARSILTVSLDSNTLSNNYTTTITGQGGGITRRASLLLTVPSDFSISTNPTSLTTPAGTSKSAQINIKSLGFKGIIDLSFNASDSHLSVVLNPTSLSFNPGETHSATLTVKSNQAGTFSVIITASSGPILRTLTVPVAITNFSLSANPASMTAQRGTTANSTISISSLGGFSGTVNLGSSASPGGLKVVFNHNSVVLSPNGTGSITMSVSSTTTTAPGTYTVLVKATSGPLAQTLTITVTIV